MQVVICNMEKTQYLVERERAVNECKYYAIC